MIIDPSSLRGPNTNMRVGSLQERSDQLIRRRIRCPSRTCTRSLCGRLSILNMYAIQQEANGRLIILDCRILTRHIWVPDLLAVVTERRIAVRSHTVELWAISTATSYHGIVAIGGWTPPSISDCD